MRLKDALKDSLVTVIADNVPPTVLADVVAIQGVVRNYSDIGMLASEDPEANARAIALRVIDEYQKLDQIEVLIRGLTRRDSGNTRFTARVGDLILQNLDEVTAGAAAGAELDLEDAANLQAAIAKRAQMLRTPALLRFMKENEGKICVIATESIDEIGKRVLRTGTGFLVGPDLVLTANHVLADHVVAGAQNAKQSGKRCAFFDHTDGDPITDPSSPDVLPRVRRVDFHPDKWLEKSSGAFPGDGKFDAANPGQITGLKNNLDMVLIRLAEPIGLYSRRRTGGARRGWIDFPPATTPQLATDDRIIIPQHPGGHPQQIDFGRFNHNDESATRIRYNTETEKGSSGAPCFNQTFCLVGMHNAAYEVPKKPRLNQAIRFDQILQLLKNDLFPLPPATKLWSVSDSDDRLEVFVGRDAFQEWIKTAATNSPVDLSQRVFIVEGSRKSGKSFSARILRASRRDLPEHVVVLSERQDRVPESAADFLRIIGEQLRIPVAELNRMPPRPSDLLQGDGDGDKLPTWLSKDLPDWFAGVLGKQRIQRVDARAEAEEVVRLLRSRGIPPSPTDIKLSQEKEPKWEDRSMWERAWIVLDDATKSTVSYEVTELLASLLGTRTPEEALARELRQLRWVFLGWRPDFLTDLKSEVLDQSNIPDEDVAVCVRALAESLDRRVKAEDIDQCVRLVRYARSVGPNKAAYDNLDTRLATLQEVIGGLGTFDDLLT